MGLPERAQEHPPAGLHLASPSQIEFFTNIKSNESQEFKTPTTSMVVSC